MSSGQLPMNQIKSITRRLCVKRLKRFSLSSLLQVMVINSRDYHVEKTMTCRNTWPIIIIHFSDHLNFRLAPAESPFRQG